MFAMIRLKSKLCKFRIVKSMYEIDAIYESYQWAVSNLGLVSETLWKRHAVMSEKNIRRKEWDVRVENTYHLKNCQDCIIDCVWNLCVIAKRENLQIKNRMACVEKCLKCGMAKKIQIKFQNRKQNIVERSFLQECIYSAGYHGEAIPELNIWI